MFRVSNGHYCMNLFNQFLLLIVIKVHVPFGEASFASSVLNQYESDLNKKHY